MLLSKRLAYKHIFELLCYVVLFGTTLSACATPPIHDREFLDVQGVYPVPFPGDTYSVDDPEWSPTGENIATLGHKGPYPYEPKLFVISLLEEQAKLITPGIWDITNFSWSPDGTKIAFIGESYNDSIQNQGIWIVDLKTGTIEMLVSEDELGGGVGDIDWSPNSNRLALIVLDRISGMNVVKILDMSTLEEKTIYQGSSEYTEIREVEWSPTEEWLAIISEGGLTVVLLKVDGSETRTLRIASKIRNLLKWNVQDRFSYLGLSWLADGQWLAVLLSAIQDGTIVLTPISGDCVIALNPAALEEPSSMDFSTDGTRIVLENLTGRGLYIVDVEEAFGSEVLPSNLMCP